MGDDAVLYEKRNHVATITINRPERMNAFNADVHRRLPELWQEVKTDDDVRVVVVTGAGDRAFSTGSVTDCSKGGTSCDPTGTTRTISRAPGRSRKSGRRGGPPVDPNRARRFPNRTRGCT